MGTRSPAADPLQMPLYFSGPGYDPAKDAVRLTGLLRRVRDYMADGTWCTIRQVAASCRGSETGTAASMRRLRKHGYILHRRRYRIASGLWQYRLEVPHGK